MRLYTCFVLCFFLAGCNVVFPGDGTLVTVDISSAIDAISIVYDDDQLGKGEVSLGQLVREALPWWDAAGAQLRAQPGGVLPIRLDSDCRWWADRDRDAGAYFPEGVICLVPKNLRVHEVKHRYDLSDVRATVAHELGHAMGLDHSETLDVVMNKKGYYPYGGLAEEDIKHLRKLWHTDQP